MPEASIRHNLVPPRRESASGALRSRTRVAAKQSLDRRIPRWYHEEARVHNPERPLAMIDLRYFKRYRMELDLARPLPPVPPLPDGYFWLPWDDNLLNAHARAKHASFHAEIDSQVFPSLATEAGCVQLMRAIRLKPGFLPGATWL